MARIINRKHFVYAATQFVQKDWWTVFVIYQAMKKCSGIFFNILNFLLAGNLPPFGCVCIIIEQEEGFLIVEQSNGEIVFPGGFLRWQERPEQAVVREGREETGFDLRPGNVVGFYPTVSQSITRMSTLTFVYQAKIVSGALRASIEGRPAWMPEKELPTRLSAYYRPIFEDYLRYRTQQITDNLHT